MLLALADSHSSSFDAADSLRLRLPAEAELAARRAQDPAYQPPCCADHEPAEAASIEFSSLEQAFFAEGERMSEQPRPVDRFDDLDDDYEAVPFWRRLCRRAD